MFSICSPGLQKQMICWVEVEKCHQDTYSSPNDHFKDIPELPNHHVGDYHDCEHFQFVLLVLRIPKTYNMLGWIRNMPSRLWTLSICTIGSKDSRNIIWWVELEKCYQDTYSSPNDHFKDIPELPDHHDGDHHDC